MESPQLFRLVADILDVYQIHVKKAPVTPSAAATQGREQP
jgi:hypothetical protein